jgi:hypothetical protein
MNRTRLTYVVMVLVFSLGLWVILRAGSGLRAAPDVAGEWLVTWEGRGEAPGPMTVTQSGTFISAVLGRGDGRLPVSLRGTLRRKQSGADVVLKGLGDPLVLTGELDSSGRLLVGTPGDRSQGAWHATRVARDSAR